MEEVGLDMFHLQQVVVFPQLQKDILQDVFHEHRVLGVEVQEAAQRLIEQVVVVSEFADGHIVCFSFYF